MTKQTTTVVIGSLRVKKIYIGGIHIFIETEYDVSAIFIFDGSANFYKKNFLYHKLVVNVFVTKEHNHINNKAPTEIILKTVCSIPVIDMQCLLTYHMRLYKQLSIFQLY